MAAGRQECLICMETCKIPKQLPCQHSFCTTCLDDYILVDQRNGQFNCPVCTESVELGKNGLSCFQTKVDIVTDSCEQITCDLCGMTRVASSRCLDCEENLCHACCHAHEKSKVSKHHKICDLGTMDPETKGTIRIRTFCDQHSEEIKLVCPNCNVFICLLCKAVNHENHVTKTLADAAAEVKKKLQVKMNSCKEKLKRLNAGEQMEKELCRRISDAEQEEIKAVEHQHSQLLKILDKEVEKLKYKIANVYGELRKENTVFKTDLKKEIIMCSSVNQNAQTLIDKGTHIEIIKKGPDFERSISEAISITDPTPPPSLMKKMFVPTEIEPSVLISLLGIMQDITAVRHTTGGFQNMPAGAQVRPAHPAGTAQNNMRPSVNVHVITGQNTAQPRAAMPVIPSNVQGRPAPASVPPRQCPPYKQSQQPPIRNVQQTQQQQAHPQAVFIQDVEPLSPYMLASAPPQEQKQMLGERLFPLIQRMYPDLAGKITGMLLEIDNSELLHMLQSSESLKAKVDEAVAVLLAFQAKEASKPSHQL